MTDLQFSIAVGACAGAIVYALLKLGFRFWRASFAMNPPRRGKTDGEKLFEDLRNGCPACGKNMGFYEGPRGGLSVNVFCCNPECKAGYNLMPIANIAEPIRKAAFAYPEEVAPAIRFNNANPDPNLPGDLRKDSE